MRHTDALAAVAALSAHPELHPTARAVYLALIIRTDDDGWCWPSVARIATDTGVHPGSVRRARAELVDAGLMLVDITPGGRRVDSTNVYRLPVEVVPTPRPVRGVNGADPAHGARSPRAQGALTPRTVRDERFNQNGKKNAPAAAPLCHGCGEPCHEPGRVMHVVCDPATPSRPVGPTVRYVGTSPVDIARRAGWQS